MIRFAACMRLLRKGQRRALGKPKRASGKLRRPQPRDPHARDARSCRTHDAFERDLFGKDRGFCTAKQPEASISAEEERPEPKCRSFAPVHLKSGPRQRRRSERSRETQTQSNRCARDRFQIKDRREMRARPEPAAENPSVRREIRRKKIRRKILKNGPGRHVRTTLAKT